METVPPSSDEVMRTRLPTRSQSTGPSLSRTEYAAAQTADSGACATGPKKAPRPTAKNPDQVSALKSSPGIRSWNRMANRPPKELLNDPDVRRWHDNLRRSSNLTCTVRLRRLNLFCDRVGMTPREMAMAGRDDPMKAENMLLDHVSWMEEKKYAPGYITGMVSAVKSWLDYNHIEIRRKIKVADSDVPVTIQDEKVPDKGQLKKILDAADPRRRAIISMMAFAGVRPQVMGLADKSDGLTLSDLPDLVLGGGDTRFERTPAMVVVRPRLSKIRKKYFTFLAEEGCQYVLGYLRERTSRGERLKPDSPFITTDFGYRLTGWGKLNGNKGRFLVTNVISSAISPIIKSVLPARPYALRAYFDSQLLIAESHGCMTHAYRQFFMGHKGDMEARYTTNKGRLTEQMTEDMRRAFEQSQAFLSTDATHDSEKDRRRMLVGMWRQQAKMYGLDPDAMIAGGALDGVLDAPPVRQQAVTISAQDSSTGRNYNMLAFSTALESDKGASGAGETTAMIHTTDAAPAAITASNKVPRQSPFESRIADGEAELLAGTAEGWDLVKDLPGERFLIRRKIPRL